MSAQLRFRTLVKHAGSIYDAVKEDRTDLLVGSLDDIVEKINPQEVSDWIKVEFDTRRLLKVWLSREQTHVAQILADQLLDSLLEFSGTTASRVTDVKDLPGPLPHLEIMEKVVPISTLLTHSMEEEEEEEEEEGEEYEEEEEEEEEEEDAPVEEKKPAPAPAPAPEPEAEDETEEETEEEVLEPSPEAEAEAEEEEGMEVEKRTIRGREYWIDIKTNKLYAVVDDDDVGDEVGAIVNGRPVFIAA